VSTRALLAGCAGEEDEEDMLEGRLTLPP